MTVAQSVEFLAAANGGRKTFLDIGTDNATIEIYGNTRPDAGDEPGSTPLLTVILSKPCGAIVDGILVLEADDPTGELIVASGTATWARFVNGDGAWAFDADVSNEGGSGEVQFPTTVLYAGGRAPLSPSSIG